MRGLWVLILATSMMSGCYTMAIQYAADVKVNDQDKPTKTILYTENVDLGGWMTGCMFSGIFFGGSCWAYLGMPYKGQIKRVRAHAEERLQQELHASQVVLTNDSVALHSWCYEKSNLAIVPIEKATPLIDHMEERRAFVCRK